MSQHSGSHQTGRTSGTVHQMNPDMQKCITDCLDCHSSCLETVGYSVQQGGKYVSGPHVKLLLDCAELCQTSANFMLRMSDLHPEVCGVCADVCDQCARDCDSYGDDAQMKSCAQICRQCAESCRKMTGVVSRRRAA
jgi:hypothetical protein